MAGNTNEQWTPVRHCAACRRNTRRKMNAAFGLLAIALAVLWHLRRRPRLLVECFLIVAMVALPWYALTYHWTGNPVFPMLNGIFQSPLWPAENRVMDAR